MSRRSLRTGANYLLIDHRDSPGIDSNMFAHLPEHQRPLPVEGGKVWEEDTYSCNHCARTVYLRAITQPLSDRGYCPKCDKYICKFCTKTYDATGVCNPLAKQFETVFNAALVLERQPDDPNARIILTDGWRT